ncbi:hypothetical protein BEL04_03145 [Mucilaginibacter sp. PPCGB 2223]|uniref:hypothetical protein n=1 Tax=Mucilaginibacter sp. PPCGB 2223 TaxID=1886027 RepID=UPI000826F016|nr:hypothetical protein [Mucilaginibacter sp. PPCGB 2223]OCX53315.1 hypothetical protein BEL04_03145 [Mucilaginibacter sp. PPCGB 2223]
MQKVLILLLIIVCISCNSADKIREEKLRDTLEKIRIKADFKPLDSAGAYNFMNNYFLPRLDTLPTKRKIFIHPLIGRDFKMIYKREEARLTAQFLGDTTKQYYPPDIVVEHAGIFINEHANWNSKLLRNTIVINDNIFKHNHHLEVTGLKAWHKKFGYGYMCISYPQYNEHTKRLFIREWIENADWCGTGREYTFGYTKTTNGWKAD